MLARPLHIKQTSFQMLPNPTIYRWNSKAFDLWRLLCLQTFLIADANRRGTIVNRRRRELSRIHEQYDAIDARFMRRVEALGLDKAPVMDLARRLAQRAAQEAGR